MLNSSAEVLKAGFLLCWDIRVGEAAATVTQCYKKELK
jgi:hypothetical protein